MSHESFDTKYLSYLSGFIRKHDGKAFAELYNYTYQRVYKYAFAFLKDPYLAQDAVQEIYTSIYKNIDALKEDSLFHSWMNQIIYHICCDFFPEGRQQSERAD